jgi:hypothetical protein
MPYVSAAEELFANPSSTRVKNVEMSSFIALFSEIPNRPLRIVCIRVQWNHSDLSGCAPRVGCWLSGV